jgi:hypothetical protein
MNFPERTFCAALWLLRMHPGSHVPLAASRKAYRVKRRSKRSSRLPSPRTAWKPSSGSFVFWVLRPGVRPSGERRTPRAARSHSSRSSARRS